MKSRVAFLLLALTASNLLAAPPTDDQVKTLIETINKSTEGLRDRAAFTAAIDKASKDALAATPLNEATFAQIETIVKERFIYSSSAIKEALAPRLTELAKEQTTDGARAALWRAMFFPNPQPTSQAEYEAGVAKMAPVYVEALKHPKLADIAKSADGDTVFAMLPAFPAAVMKSQNILGAVEPLITTDLSPQAAAGLGTIIDTIADEESGVDKATRLRFLDKISAATAAVLAKKPAEPAAADVPMYARIADAAKMSKSSWAKGELIGGPAPEVKFIWTSTGASPKSLADLKGKVVLIDFWATWCGPCVASFPKVRELQDRYKDFPVAIVGVTSVQGFSMDRSGPKPQRIDTKGDQQKEFDLMNDFMKNNNMTWPVVFSEDSCFNPGFGVRGIPHLAIIDPNGVVRFNGLRPGNPAEEAEKIDALLKEFKLAAPEKPMGEKKAEEAAPGK